jgi:beta-aspartyl-peptidase (threonine type)
MTPALIVHGGAGAIAAEREEPARLGCLAAALAGLRVLASGGRALDAVQAAVRVLEDDPLFNAGTGSVLSREETIEVDASIMDGATLKIGAVAAVPDLPDAVALARAILDDGEHIVLAGPAAWTFARERGFSPAAPGAMITERARQRLAEERARRAGGPPPSEREGGTVGAAAIDASGHVAAATSTGGIVFKRPGRVGDSPLPGCGTWADDAGGAASATGDGEQIIRVTLTRMLVERLVAGASAGEAARAAIDDLVKRTGGSAGVICVDRAGRLGATHASETMSCAGGVVEDGAIRAEAWVRPRELEDLHAIVRAAPIR